MAREGRGGYDGPVIASSRHLAPPGPCGYLPAEELHALSREQKWDEMTKLVPDDVLDVFVLRST